MPRRKAAKEEKKEKRKITVNDMGLYAMALGILYLVRDVREYKILSPLALMLDRESFDNLIDHFGGMRLKIPTREDLNVALQAIVAYQLRSLGDTSETLLKKMHDAGFTDMTLSDAKRVMSESLKIGNSLGSLNADLFLEKERKRKYRGNK